MSILVTGGAGYIGSATVALLLEAGESVLVIDNLILGHRAAVPAGVPWYQADVGDHLRVAEICRQHDVDTCVHFAGFSNVGESVTDPAKYYRNNLQQGIALLTALQANGVQRVIFSSTCATYGEPRQMPMDESHPQAPINPYGWSKLALEQVLRDFDKAYGMRHVALRYFNAAGALPHRGEDHRPETHLIPIVIEAALGRRPQLDVYGDDYPTSDGTAVRDYIHIRDLGSAHISAINYLRSGGKSAAFNLGNGSGYSVMEVIDAVRRVSGLEVPFRIGPRRQGDPARLIADAEQARRELAWQPQHPDLDDIVATAWRWHSAHPAGYAD